MARCTRLTGVFLAVLFIINQEFGLTQGDGAGTASVYFTEQPKGQQAYEGSTVVLRCGVNDRINVQFYWIKDGAYLFNTSRVYEERGMLTILRISRKDAGLYKCVASNIATSYVLFSEPALLTVRTTQSSDSTTQEVDLLKILGLPDDVTVLFSFGVDHFPAFKLSSLSNIKKTSFDYFGPVLPENFVIVTLIKPESRSGGYLFTVVNPLGKIELGLQIAASVFPAFQHIILYYTEYSSSLKSHVLANFTVPVLTGQWAKVVLKVEGKIVTLFVNCEEIEVVNVLRSGQKLTFSPGASLYVGQAGNGNPGRFLGSFQVLKVLYDIKAAEDTEFCDSLTMVGSGSGSGETVDIDNESGESSMHVVTDFKGMVNTEGTKGTKGDKGEHGSKGERGEAGVQGPPGQPPPMITPPPPDISALKGDRGDKGDRGEIGLPGLIGTPGRVGEKGQQGLRGLKGDIGLPGSKGDTGFEGRPGEKGEPGTSIQGEKGAQGPPGQAAPSNSLDTLPVAEPVKGDRGDLGPPGEPGAPGTPGEFVIGPPGPPGPPGPAGRPGNTTVVDDEGSGEVELAPVPGPEGPQGLPGQGGPRGPKGEKGMTGGLGLRGPQGHQGVAGLRVSTSAFMSRLTDVDKILQAQN